MTKNILFLLATATTLVTMGAGCTAFSTPTTDTQPTAIQTPATPAPVPVTAESTPSPITETPALASGEPRVLVAAETNDTWKLYTNKALGYSVNTPTKGKYVPNWEIKHVDQNDPRISGDCFTPVINTGMDKRGTNAEVSTLDGTKFCHTNVMSVRNGEFNPIIIDDYATALGKKFIVIEFIKLPTDAVAMGCAKKMTEPYSLSETACIPFVSSEYQKTLDGIVGTFKMNALVAVTTPNEDLEKSIRQAKDFSYLGADVSNVSGYPVVFTTTTDPAVRFTMLTESGGDAMHTTFYFINQAKQKIVQTDTDVYGGDFDQTGDLTLTLKGGPTAVIKRVHDVDDAKREITYKGLMVNQKMGLTFTDPIVWTPEGALEFSMLGVSPDLTHAYFVDGLKQYDYDMVNGKLQEINEVPSFVAKPTNRVRDFLN